MRLFTIKTKRYDSAKMLRFFLSFYDLATDSQLCDREEIRYFMTFANHLKSNKHFIVYTFFQLYIVFPKLQFIKNLEYYSV